MSPMRDQVNTNVIVGLGQTGYSLARYFARSGQKFRVVDSRNSPPLKDAFKAEFPEVELHLGSLGKANLDEAQRLLMSPGVALSEPAIASAIAAGAAVCSDIDLFCEMVDVQIIAITGSNAKSTVTTLVGEMAQAAGIHVGVGGNIGVPVLDLLEQGPHDIYVLELSSFQLEVTHKLRANVAVILNLSADHMDRYEDLASYRAAKQRIFRGCPVLVNNLDDPQLPAALDSNVKIINFGTEPEGPVDNAFGLRDSADGLVLMQGEKILLPVSALKVRGKHNYSNALAALAIGQSMGLPMSAMLTALQSFTGLEHRCQWVASIQGVEFYNDSKGTNVGATIAALHGLGGAVTREISQPGIVLIAGGDGKGAAFTPLVEPVTQYVKAALLIGRDASNLCQVLQGGAKHIPVQCCEDLDDAVLSAWQIATSGDTVLLSPACASTDMFSDYRARGRAFAAAVEKLQ